MDASLRRGRRVLVVAAMTLVGLVPITGAEAVTRPQTLADQRPATVEVVVPGFPIDHLGVVFELPAGAEAHHDHDGEAHPGVEGVAVRFRTARAWGPWQSMGEDGAQAEGQWTGALVPGGDADAYQVRGVPGEARNARVAAINTTDGPAEVVGYRTRGAAEASTPCQSRADWGADETLGHKDDLALTDLQVTTVHHTAGVNDDPDPAATIRAIHRYHTQTNGWADIGYQALVGPDGVLYEGRWSGNDSVSCVTASGDGRDFGHETTADGARVVTGAHAGGFNTGNYGVALLGTYTDVAPPAAARSALVTHLAEVTGRHGLDPLGTVAYDNGTNAKTLPSILGHRDVTATECPGGVLYADLPAIRQDVAAHLASPEPDSGDTTAPDEPTTDEPTVDEPTTTEAVASGESTTVGTTSGTWTATTVADGTSQQLTEAESGGKPARRTSELSHTWQVPGVSAPAVLEVTATTPASSDGDQFALAVSADGGTTWAPVMTLPGATTGTWSVALPADVAGTVLVRVTDTDRSAGNLGLDTLAVDHLVVRWGDTTTTSPPPTTEPEPEPSPSPEPTHPGKGNGNKG